MIAAGTIGAIGSIGGAAIGSNAATTAAGDQESAANNAANLQYQASQNALGFQEQQWNQDQANEAPWLQSGAAGLANLDYLLGVQPPTTQGAMTGSPQAGSTGFPNQGAAPQTPANPAQRLGVQSAAQMGAGMGPTSTPGNAAMGTTQTGTVNGGGNPQANPGHGTVQMPTGTAMPAAQGTAMSANGTGNTPVPSVPSSGPTGSTNLGSTVNPSLGGFGSLLAPYQGTFTAPTAQQALNSPGEQAQLQLGDQAMQQSAAAQGNLLTGGTAQALDAYGQNLASTNYQNTYNNAYNTYATNYNQYQQQQTNEYNRLASLAGMGQTSAQTLGTLGQSASNNVSSNLMGTASAIGQDYNNAAAANASGVVGSANAWSGALGSGTSGISNLMLLNSLGNSTTTDNGETAGQNYNYGP
jgi:hypothetical protein